MKQMRLIVHNTGGCTQAILGIKPTKEKSEHIKNEIGFNVSFLADDSDDTPTKRSFSFWKFLL